MPDSTSLTCISLQPCLLMHNGGKLKLQSLYRFGQTANNHYIYFTFDPDGKYSGSTVGPGKSVTIDLYYNGRISINGRVAGDTTYQGATPNTWGNAPAADWWDGWEN
ncbi:MAG: hypothetical protein VKJ04_03935 [Vampirovibrionales bacterium]|nr:hypothetical protein [Vampirovibrionales bacterium]